MNLRARMRQTEFISVHLLRKLVPAPPPLHVRCIPSCLRNCRTSWGIQLIPRMCVQAASRAEKFSFRFMVHDSSSFVTGCGFPVGIHCDYVTSFLPKKILKSKLWLFFGAAKENMYSAHPLCVRSGCITMKLSLFFFRPDEENVCYSLPLESADEPDQTNEREGNSMSDGVARDGVGGLHSASFWAGLRTSEVGHLYNPEI